MSGSLFERLSMNAPLSDDNSIRNHLMRMLTTRQGAVQTKPDYGLPDINDLTMSRSELTAHICSAIEHCIQAYEPRLTQAKVVALPVSDNSPMRLNFSIKAQKIHNDGRQTPWNWHISLDGEVIAELS